MSDRILFTSNHLYCEKGTIGQGATSKVYIGHDRRTGEKRALKISKFNHAHFHREIQREIEAFLSLRHVNIVEFYGIEEEVESGKHVIVMEYCSGGSLYSLLQEPENKYGLVDSEFLILLQDLRNGLQYMTKHGFAHRDIKPGNILRSINNNGRSVFKLSDFGTSRQRNIYEDDDRAMSLVGTEEYLHPNIYRKAFIQRDSHLAFSIAMDIWSLGATLFHAACGEVPFQPFGGPRKNKQQMYEMISRKPSGKIRGMQEKEHGDILWSENFPNTCQMSVGLRTRVERIVAGLMEARESQQWSYQTFFTEVSNLTTSTVVLFLNISSLHLHKVYVDTCPSYRLAYLKEMIAMQTEIGAADQELYYDFLPVEDIFNSDTAIKDYPKTTYENPIVLLTSNMNANHEIVFKQEPVALMSSQGTLANDLKIATTMCYSVCRIQRFSLTLSKNRTAVYHFVKHISKYIQNDFKESEKDFDKLSALITEKLSRLNVITQDPSLSSGEEKDDITKAFTSTMKTKLEMQKQKERVKEKLTGIKSTLENVTDGINHILGDKTDTCSTTLQFQMKEIQRLQEKFKSRSKARSLNAIQEVQLMDERRRMNEIYVKTNEHWRNCCQPGANKALEVFHTWNRKCSQMKKTLQDTKQLLKNLKSLCWTFDNNLITLSAYSCREWSNNCDRHMSKSPDIYVTDLTTDHSSADKSSYLMPEVKHSDVIIQGRQMMLRLANETSEFSNVIQHSVTDSGLGMKSSSTLNVLSSESDLAEPSHDKRPTINEDVNTINSPPSMFLSYDVRRKGTSTKEQRNFKTSEDSGLSFLSAATSNLRLPVSNDANASCRKINVVKLGESDSLFEEKRVHQKHQTDWGQASLSKPLDCDYNSFNTKHEHLKLPGRCRQTSQKEDLSADSGRDSIPQENEPNQSLETDISSDIAANINNDQLRDTDCKMDTSKYLSKGFGVPFKFQGSSTGPPFTKTSSNTEDNILEVQHIHRSLSDTQFQYLRKKKDFSKKENCDLLSRCPQYIYSNYTQRASKEESHEVIYPERDKP